MRSNLLALVGLLLVTGCSENAGELLPSATIGPEGGRVGRGLVVLDVPAGALDAPQLIAVFDVVDRSQLSFPGEAVSNFYRFEPQGLTLKTPATVSFGEVSAARPAVVWSTASEEDVLEAVESVMVDGRLAANVSHFSIGGVANQADTTLDAGVTDTGPTDTGVVDTGDLDAGIPDTGAEDTGVIDTGIADAGPADTGVLDAEPEDTGIFDTGIFDTGIHDTGIHDTGIFDTGVPDTGVPDTGTVDAGVVTILPVALNGLDACLETTDALQVSGGTASSWRLLSPIELQQWSSDPAYTNTTLDPATGVMTRAATNTLQSYFWSTGVEVTLTDGRTATHAWDFVGPGIGQYVVSQGGGPAIFSQPSIPPISQANVGAWTPVQVAMPLGQHPCSGLRFSLDSFGCTGNLADFMEIDAQGLLQIADPAFVPLVTPGTFCYAVTADWGTASSPIYLDSAVYSIVVTP